MNQIPTCHRLSARPSARVILAWKDAPLACTGPAAVAARAAAVVLGVVLLGCGGMQRGLLEPALPPSAWIEDVRVLARELPARHVDAFHTMDEAAFDSAVAALEASIPGRGPEEIYVDIRRLICSIGDGHTNVSTPPNWPWLPLRFRWFREPGSDVDDPLADPAGAGPGYELRVTHAAPGYESALGARVVGVGDVPIDVAYRALSTIVPGGETEGWTRERSIYYMRRPHILHGLGLARTADSVRLALEDAAGRAFTVTARPIAADDAVDWERAAERLPRWLARSDEPYWFTRVTDADADSSAVYLGLNGSPGYFDFWRRSRALLSYIDEHAARRLVIDLRNNTGGDYNKVRWFLIPGLRDRLEDDRPLERVYVLIGPVTFSAAMTNAVDLRRELGAVLVGEPTGARPNQYQEGRTFGLPNSRLVIGYSTKYYRFQDEDTPGVLPDHRVSPTWDDYRHGRDPVLARALDRSPSTDDGGL